MTHPPDHKLKNTKAPFAPPHLLNAARWHGKRIGLLGGSFNPAHAGHVHIAKLAMAKFDLDFVWWLVTPQNPLKTAHDMAPYAHRFQSVAAILGRAPQMMATHLESGLGTRYTFETVKGLKAHFPKTSFLFICGHDNALLFHRWDRWRALSQEIPIVFIARPPAQNLVKNCPIKMQKRPKFAKGRKTPLKGGDIYWLKTTRMLAISSTQIRNKSKG